MVDFRDIGLARLSLDRCGGGTINASLTTLPRNFHKGFNPHVIMDGWKKLLDPHTNQVETLVIEDTLDTMCLARKCLLRVGLEFPNLVDLKLLVESVSRAHKRMRKIAWKNARKEFFPALRSISVHAVRIPWDSGLFINLVKLELENQ